MPMNSLGDWVTLARARASLSARRSVAVLGVTAVATAGLTAVAGSGPAGAVATARSALARTGPSNDEVTISQDDLRTGWDPNEPALTPAAVKGGSFGQIFSTAVNGSVYGQPLVVGGTLIATTENNWVYGLNAATGAVLWKTFLGTPYHITYCNDLVPNIGVTSTPVYDPSSGRVYVLALVHEVSWQWHLFGIDASTGTISYKRRLVGHPTNDNHLTLGPLNQGQRSGLLLMNGWVYATFASHCDYRSYTGYVAGFNVGSTTSTAKTTLWTDEADVSYVKGGIWQSGGGLMSDGSGRIFVTSGNGISPAPGPGTNPPGELAESVIRLGVNSTTGALAAQDFFSPKNAPALDASDTDFGSGGPTGLPFGTTTYPDEVAQAGKDGRIFVLDRDDLGGREQGPGSTDQFLAEGGPYAGQWGHPAFFADTPTLTTGNAPTSNDYMVFAGRNDFMREFKFGVSGRGDKPAFSNVANSTFTFGFGSGSPTITSNGTDATTGVIWEVHNNDGSGSGAFLGAWQLLPVPRSGGGVKITEIWSAPIGTSSKFSVAATNNGMVYVGTRDGHVFGFGLTGGAALARSGSAQFQDTPVGSSASRRVGVTATRTVTVTGASVTAAATPAPFTLGAVTVTRRGSGTPVSVKFPVTLDKGDALRAVARFTPSTVGGADGVVSFTTAAEPSVPVSVPLTGDGTSTGLYMSNPSLSFVINEHDGLLIENVPVGVYVPIVDDLVNGSTKPATVTSISRPSGGYRVSGLPKAGTVIKPGEAIPLRLLFEPQHAGAASSSLTITASDGTSVTVAMTGTGLRPVTKFTASPRVVHFGSVPVGHNATRMIRVDNDGNQPSVMGRSGLSGGAFGAPLRIPDGLPVSGDNSLVLPVVFHPAKTGAYHGTYQVTWTDRFGGHSLLVPITGTGVG
jgi:outer membrane protein assembly factor BamB